MRRKDYDDRVRHWQRTNWWWSMMRVRKHDNPVNIRRNATQPPFLDYKFGIELKSAKPAKHPSRPGSLQQSWHSLVWCTGRAYRRTCDHPISRLSGNQSFRNQSRKMIWEGMDQWMLCTKSIKNYYSCMMIYCNGFVWVCWIVVIVTLKWVLFLYKFRMV